MSTFDDFMIGQQVKANGELEELRDRCAQVEAERDNALANADFWERELANFRRNAAHRAEQLAKEKVEAAESEVTKLKEALRRGIHMIEHGAGNEFWEEWRANAEALAPSREGDNEHR